MSKMTWFVSFSAMALALMQGRFGGVDASDDEMKRTVAQIDWLVEKHGGYVNPKISFAPLGDLPSAAKGVFVSEEVPRGETLIIIPQSAILSSGKTSFMRDHDVCDTARNLVKQYRLGEESDYWPYVNHVFSNNIHGRLPSQWSEEGKKLLELITPKELADDLVDLSFADACLDDESEDESYDLKLDESEDETQKESEIDRESEIDIDKDPLIEDAYMVVTSRSWDDKMMPVYDMISHRNGNWTNVESNSVHKGKDVFVFAVRDIKKGEQLYLSYNECSDCEEYTFTYSLLDLVRDYGFVEQYPRRLSLAGMVFDIDQRYIDGEEQLYVTWREETEPRFRGQINFLLRHHSRLLNMREQVYELADQLESSHERSVNLELYETLKIAMFLAIEDATGSDVEEDVEEEVCDNPSCEDDS